MQFRVIRHALAFVSGFSFTFVLLFGIPTTLLGSFLYAQRGWIGAVGGCLLILFGLHMTGALRVAARLSASRDWLRPLGAALVAFNRALDAWILSERRLRSSGGSSPGYLRSFIVGVTFAAGWTPCIGPLLGLVLTLAAIQPGEAMPLLLAYSAGLAMPFLVSAAVLGAAVRWLKQLNRHAHAVEIVSGALLITFGVMLVQGSFAMLNALLSGTPEWIAEFEAILARDMSTVTLPMAGLAGLLSFLSPCILPLVPVYLSYLSGTAVGGAPVASVR
ncbi:MAG: hypothetical protein DDG58_05930 [Ardenticatenia bacterium]|nr:MAG: hypothetical protein DDG58_05930 [Ardenticatenia bacterium]